MLGGWFLDVFVEYVYRLIHHMIRRICAGRWRTSSGTLTSTHCPTKVIGCAIAEICYTYRVDGELYTGMHREPCFFRDSAERYIRDLPEGKVLAVRFDPNDPTKSILA